MTEIKKNYKEKMKEIMPEQFSEKTLIERIEERMNKAKKEHSDNKDLAISQFGMVNGEQWNGYWRR